MATCIKAGQRSVMLLHSALQLGGDCRGSFHTWYTRSTKMSIHISDNHYVTFVLVKKHIMGNVHVCFLIVGHVLFLTGEVGIRGVHAQCYRSLQSAATNCGHSS